jgi:hypothetical protein
VAVGRNHARKLAQIRPKPDKLTSFENPVDFCARGTNQFTEWSRPDQYDTDRWIVNKVTFYLTFC